MNNLEDLMAEQLISLFIFTDLNRVIDIKSLVNKNYKPHDIIGGILYKNSETVKETELSKEKFELLYSAEKIGLDTSDIQNPFLSYEQLKFIIEFKKQGIDVDYVINPNLTIEEMSMIVNYVIFNGYEDEYSVIRYMGRCAIDKLLSIIKSDIGALEFLKGYKDCRDGMISYLNKYINNFECSKKRMPTHKDFVKVYTQNRYKKNM